MKSDITLDFLAKKATMQASRSSGVGGQNVNRRSTKVQLHLKVEDLPLTEDEKKKIRRKLNRHINENDELFAVCEEERTQLLNRRKAEEHLKTLIDSALVILSPRIPVQPSYSANIKRVEGKKIKSQRKQNRRRLEL
ncbi:MAG: peptide chain release factor-like protein [bacterium]|nr:peptide chain release factor-like protein [bacterium]